MRRPPSCISRGTRVRTRIAPAVALVVAAVLGGLGCGSEPPADRPDALGPTAPTAPPPDTVASGPPAPEVDEAAADLFDDPLAEPSSTSLDVIGASNDLRMAWYLADRLRYEPTADVGARIVTQLQRLTGVDPPPGSDGWTFYVDLLLAWDVPPPPDYLTRKRTLHLAHDPTAAPFFDAPAAVDWRRITTTGAARDEVAPLDDPEVVPSSTTIDWLADDDIVFGVHVSGERRAYPRRVLRAHEIINDTVGERRIVLIYCDVCGAAVAWYGDGGAGVEGDDNGVPPVDLRSSGLALRGAPLAYDESTSSLFDPLLGRALTGPLADAGVSLQPLATVTTTWGAWSGEPSEGTVVSNDGGVDRIYIDEPDSTAPRPWPVGPRDDRLASDRVVLGVRTGDGGVVAFPVEEARRAVAADGGLRWSGVEVQIEGGGLAARDRYRRTALASHESSWAAWSQSHPDTKLWTPDS